MEIEKAKQRLAELKQEQKEDPRNPYLKNLIKKYELLAKGKHYGK